MASTYRLAELFGALRFSVLSPFAADCPAPKERNWIARYVLIPGGHGTTGMAKLWKQNLVELLQKAPRR